MGSVWIRRRQSCNRRGEEWRAALGPTNDNVVVLHLAVLLTHTRCRSTVFFYLVRGRLFLLGCKRHALSNYLRMNSEMESFNWVWFAGNLTCRQLHNESTNTAGLLATFQDLLNMSDGAHTGIWQNKYDIWPLQFCSIFKALKSELAQQPAGWFRRHTAAPCQLHFFSSMFNIFHFLGAASWSNLCPRLEQSASVDH